MSPAPPPPGRGRKVRGVQTKKDVSHRVQTKSKRLSPFLNPQSEKGAGDMHLAIRTNQKTFEPWLGLQPGSLMYHAIRTNQETFGRG